MSSAGSSGGSNLSNAAGQLAAEALVNALPPQVQDLLKPGKTPDRIHQAISWASRRDPAVLTAHQKHGNKVATFEDIRNVHLEGMDRVAHHFARRYRRRAGLTGAITGLPGGLWAVAAAGADVQLTAIYAVRMAADIAQSYGYDTTDAEEQAHLAEVLALAAGIDSLRGIGNWLTREGLIHVLPEILPKILIKLSVQLTEEQAAKWVGRIIPGVGAAVGATIDYSFLRAAGERATKYYHNRYLVDHGMAPPEILGEPAPSLAPPPPGPVVEGSLAPAGQPAQLPASRPPLGQQLALPAPARRPVKHRRSAPERFAIWLGIWALIFLVITVGACAALIIIAANFVSSHV
jgi:EcsC protein family